MDKSNKQNNRFKRSKSLPKNQKKPEVITKATQLSIYRKIKDEIYQIFKVYEKREEKQEINKNADILAWSRQKGTFFFPRKMKIRSNSEQVKKIIKKMVKEMSKKPHWKLKSMKRCKKYKLAIFNYYKFHRLSIKICLIYIPIALIISIFLTIITGFNFWRIDIVLVTLFALMLPLIIYLKIKQKRKIFESKNYLKVFLEQREAQLLSTISKYNLMELNKLGYEVKVGIYGGYLILRELESGLGRSIRNGTVIRDKLVLSGFGQDDIEDNGEDLENLEKENFSSVDSNLTQSLLLEEYDVYSAIDEEGGRGVK